MNRRNKIFTPNILLVDLIVVFTFFLLTIFSMKHIFVLESNLTYTTSISIYTPLFLFCGVGLGFILYVENKFKRLQFKNIFIYLAIIVAVFNLIASLCVPNNYLLPFDQKLSLDVNKRLYSSLIGFVVAGLLILYFYILPKKFNNAKYVEFIFFALAIFTEFIILFSLFAEGKTYIEIIRAGFSTDLSVKSFVGHKNSFGQWLFIGISSTILLTSFSKNNKWIFLLVPMVIVLPFTQCKISLLLSILIILTFAIYRFIVFVKKSKNNLFIGLICATFIIFLIIIISILMAFSNSGFLFKIKSLLNKIFTQGSSTLKSRVEIWKCCFALLSPLQIIIGCGSTIFNEAIHIVYSKAGVEDATHIWNAHNGVIELIGEGGIVLLLINIILFVIVIKHLLTTYKKNKEISILYFTLILLYILYSLVEPVAITGFDNSISFNFLIIVPILSISRYSFDKDAIKENKELLILSSKIKINKNDNFFEKLNKRYIKLSGKCLRIK